MLFSLCRCCCCFFFFFDYLNYTRFLFILSLHTTCSQSFSCLYENGCYELTMKCKLCQRYSFGVCLCVCILIFIALSIVVAVGLGFHLRMHCRPSLVRCHSFGHMGIVMKVPHLMTIHRFVRQMTNHQHQHQLHHQLLY